MLLSFTWGDKNSSSNFYACHLLQSSPIKALAIVKNSSYKEIYSRNNPDFKSGGNFTNSNGTILSIFKIVHHAE